MNARHSHKAEQAIEHEKHQRKLLDEEHEHLEEIMANTAHLRELRLAKEAAERKAKARAKKRSGT